MFVLLGGGQRAGEFRQQFGAQRVKGLGPLQGEEADTVFGGLHIQVTRHVGFLWLHARHIKRPAFLGIVCRGVAFTMPG
ncbi:hypothetical protein D3C80_2074210 [compost metagenome]